MRVAGPNRRALGVATAAALVIACGVDFEPTETTGPSGPASQSAMLSATLRFSTGESQEPVGPPRAVGNASPRRGEVGSGLAEEGHATVQFNALFFPGLDGRGVVRAVTNDTITVLDRKIVGQEGGSSGALVFRDEWSLVLEDGEGAARLQMPHVAGREQPPPALEFRLCRGEGPYDLAISRDDTLRFEISCQRTVKSADQAYWEMTFRSADGRSTFGFSGGDSLPPSIPMPAPTLEQIDQSELIATLRISEAWQQESNGDYQVFLSVHSESSWILHWK